MDNRGILVPVIIVLAILFMIGPRCFKTVSGWSCRRRHIFR